MKPFLLYRDQDVDWSAAGNGNANDLVSDLGLEAIFSAMSGDDRAIAATVPPVMLGSLREVSSIRYRQDVLRDALEHRSTVRTMYELADEAILKERQCFWGFGARQHPSSIVRRGRELLPMFFGILKQLRGIAESRGAQFSSEGFTRFFDMLRRELDDDYLTRADELFRAIEFPDGILLSAALGPGNRGAGYVLRYFMRSPRSWFERIFPAGDGGLTYRVHPRDESGLRAFAELSDRGVDLVANALAQSADHILAFFTALKAELAFYIGCVSLHERLTESGIRLCFPTPFEAGSRRRRMSELCDPVLALATKQSVIGNEIDADEKSLIVLTGANRGGKSTLLRAIGTAQVMMQCGMFVAAKACAASLCTQLFTHYKREEDSQMQSGKFDEELRRMSGIAGCLSRDALVLFNESFSATNDREGSEIAGQIVEALLDSGVEVAFVTHLHEFAHSLWEKRRCHALFLRAPRGDDGERTFTLSEGEPLPTSYGEDIYSRVFGADVLPSAY